MVAAVPLAVRRVVAQQRDAGNAVQGELPPVDRRGGHVVRVAARVHVRDLRPHRRRGGLVPVAGDPPRGLLALHPAGVHGVLPDERLGHLGAHPDGSAGLHAPAPGEHAVPRVVSQGGPGRVRERRVRAGRDRVGLAQPRTRPGPVGGRGLPAAMRVRRRHPLLAHVHARVRGLLDGSHPGRGVGVLQPVQHRAHPGGGVPQRMVPPHVHVGAAHDPRVQRPFHGVAGNDAVAVAGVVLAGLALACLAASEALWRIALRRYSSASA